MVFNYVLGTAKYGITEFTDMTSSEFQMRKGLLVNYEENRVSNPLAEIPNIKLPKSFDWRKHGAVSEVLYISAINTNLQ